MKMIFVKFNTLSENAGLFGIEDEGVYEIQNPEIDVLPGNAGRKCLSLRIYDENGNSLEGVFTFDTEP